MPTINISLKDLQSLTGKINISELKDALEYCKAEIDSMEGDNLSIALGDTNLPYLWSVEGIARFIKLFRGKTRALQAIKTKPTGKQIIVDSSIKPIRPYIAGFVAKGKLNEFLLKQMIQLQEKIADNYGMRRKKVSIGIYNYNQLKFPLHYKAVEPKSAEFVPLDFKIKMNLAEILQQHPKGIEYKNILKDFKKYPIFTDDENKILSFPPIINSNDLGKVDETQKELFIEVTGTDLNAVNLAANIFAYAFAERNFEISSVKIKYNDKIIETPILKTEKIKIDLNNIEKYLGIKLNEAEIKKLLEKAGFNYSKGIVEIPCYRQDIMHEVDIIEEIAVMHGYNKLGELSLTSYTSGKSLEIADFSDKIRNVAVGLGYQEIMSAILANPETMNSKILRKNELAEIENYMSLTYSCVRNSLLPVLIDVLSKNKHNEYPQKIFEEGIVTEKHGKILTDKNKFAIVSAHASTNYTEMKQNLDVIAKAFGFEYEIKEISDLTFIKGRTGEIVVKGKTIGIIGEIAPNVLSNFDLLVPVSAMEIDLDSLNNLI